MADHLYKATIDWRRGEGDFAKGRYSRGHLWRFDGGIEVPASASPAVVPLPLSRRGGGRPGGGLRRLDLVLPHADLHRPRPPRRLRRRLLRRRRRGRHGAARRPARWWISKVTLRPQHRLLRRQRPTPTSSTSSTTRPTSAASSPIRCKTEIVVDAASGRLSQGLTADALPPPYRCRPRRHAGADRRPVDRRAVRRHPGRQAARRPRSTCRRARARSRSSASSRASRRGTSPPASVPFFVGAGAYRHHVPRERRPPHPALGVPDLLHALPAGDRAGHAAISLRVPDPGREPDRHGGRQRLHVRRLDRHRRGGADGAPPDSGGRRYSPAACIRNIARWSRRSRAWPATRWSSLPPDPLGTEAILAAIDGETSCVVVQSPSFYGQLIDLAPIAEKAHAPARCSSRSSPRSWRSAPSSRRARRAPTSSSAKASRSATR